MKKLSIHLTLLALLAGTTHCTNKEASEPVAVSQDNTIYETVDAMPEFEGGTADFISYIQKNLKYPEEAKKQGIEGKVFVEFVVSKTGQVDQVKVIKGIGYGCDEEALKVLKNSPKWNPGVQDGFSVNVKMVLPISFKLS